MIKGLNYRNIYYKRNIKEDSKNNNIQNSKKKENKFKFKYKGIKIPKLLLNKNLSDIFNSKRIKNSHNKKINNISSKNFLFIENSNKKELTNYYYIKNKSIINDISLNSKRKISNLSTSETKKENFNKNIIKIKSNILNNNIKKEYNNSLNNSYNKIKKIENEKNYINTMNTSFLSSKFDDPFLDIKFKKYIKEKEKERTNLFLLINNPFGKNGKKINRFNSQINRRLILEKLLKPKKIDNDIYDTINNEYNNALINSKIVTKDKILEKNLLRKKLLRNKLGNKLKPQKFLVNSGETSQNLVDNEISLIKNKINNNHSNIMKFDFMNDFHTNLYLSLSDPTEQLYNTRLYGKYINDNSLIKSLIEEVAHKYNKINV